MTTQPPQNRSLLMSVASRLPALIAQAEHLEAMTLALKGAGEEAAGPDGLATRTERWAHSAEEALEAAENLITLEPAATLAEASLQLMIAVAKAEILTIGTLDEDMKASEAAALVRLLRSALPLVSEAAGIDLEAFGLSHYADRGSDPFFRGAHVPAAFKREERQRSDAEMLQEALLALRGGRVAVG